MFFFFFFFLNLKALKQIIQSSLGVEFVVDLELKLG